MTRIDLTTAKSVKLKTGGKYCAEDIQVVPNLETVNVTPTTAEQNFSVGSGFSGIGDVKVGAIQTETSNVKSSLVEQTIRPTADNKYINEIKVAPMVLETAEIQPTTSEQVIRPSEGADGLSSVKFGAVNPADYYKPESVAEVTPTTSEQNITPTEGSVFSGVKVKAIQTEQTTIKTNGTHTPSAGKFFDKVIVEVADIPAKLQEKNVTPTREPQTVLPDTNYEGMSKVTVEPIPAEFIVPSGSITATENKTYDVTEVKQVVVAVPEKAGAKLIEGSATKNGEYWARDYGADGFEVFTVNVEEKYKEPEGSMLIEANGDYDVKDLAEVQVRVPEKEDLDAELQAQDEALTELEDAVNNLPDKSEGTGGVAVNVVGAWTINPDGSANTETGVYYNFTHDGKVQVVALGNVTDLGTYIIDGNVINITGDAGNQIWYYNEDGGIAVEENAESMMWRLVPQGTLEVKENGDYDVTPNTKVTVSVSAPELIEYTITQDTDLSGGNVEFLPKYDNIIDEDLDLSTLTLDDCGQTYGFEYSTSTNRIEPLNKKKVSSFAYCKIRFAMKSDGGSLAVTIYQSSEVNYDYGFISKLDTDLNKNADGSDVNSVYNSKGLQGNYTYTFTDIPAGEHFFTFKYRKDTSNDTGEDTCAITNIHINDIEKLEADGFSKVTLEKPTDLESNNILSGKTVFGVEGNLVIADYQSTTATPQDVLLGKKFLSEEGVIIEGSVEEFVPASEYKTNVVLNTKGKIVSENITINVTAEGARDAKETMYEMQEADYMRYLQGQISIYDVPSEAEYLEQQEYVNSAIAIIMGEEF